MNLLGSLITKKALGSMVEIELPMKLTMAEALVRGMLLAGNDSRKFLCTSTISIAAASYETATNATGK